MKMSMVDFHPSVVFIHQNCDSSLEERHIFLKKMDKAVSIQAGLIQKQDRFKHFQDIADVSLDDKKVILFIFLNSLKVPRQCLHPTVVTAHRAPIWQGILSRKWKKIS